MNEHLESHVPKLIMAIFVLGFIIFCPKSCGPSTYSLPGGEAYEEPNPNWQDGQHDPKP